MNIKSLLKAKKNDGQYFDEVVDQVCYEMISAFNKFEYRVDATRVVQRFREVVDAMQDNLDGVE